MSMRNLWKSNPDLKHVPKFYGSKILPVGLVAMEYFELSLESFVQSNPNSLIDTCLQMLAAVKELHR